MADFGKDFMGSLPGSITDANNSILNAGTSFANQAASSATSAVNSFTTGFSNTATNLTNKIPSFADLSSVKSLAAGNFSSNINFTPLTNAFPHVTDNIVTTPAANTTARINLNTAFEPNILDNYDVVTYHWKLFIVTPDAASTGNIFDLNVQTIIAESGVSDLTIDKVEIRSIMTPSVESGTGTSTNVKFEVVEPAGAGLIDKMFYEALALGIGNWSVMPIYLQLQFRGRTPGTSEADDGSPGTIGSMRWIWPLKLRDIKANVTTVGTRYEFTAIIYNEFAQSNAVFSMQHSIVLKDLENFQDAMQKLQNELNEDQIFKLIDNASIPDTYKIIVDPLLALSRVTPIDNNTNSIRNNSTAVFDRKNASFPASTSVDKIIDSLLAQSNKYQKSMLNASTPGAEGQPMTEEVSQMKKFWRIITETRPLKFDPRRETMANEFTIFIIEYDIGILDANTFQDTNPPLTIEQERKRLMTYIEKSILKKKYNYIFTGLNDQIINFDIKINNAFASAVARMGGIYFNTAMADKGVVNQEHSKEEASVTEKVQRAISFQNNSAKSNSAEATAALKDAQQAISTSKLSTGQQDLYKLLLDKQKPESKLAYLQKVQAAGGINQDKTLNQLQIQAKSLATPIKDTSTQQNLNFVSDVNINGQDAKNAYSNYIKDLKGKLRPIARIDTMQQRQVGMGVESNSNSGIQKLSSMFAVALHSSLDASFMQTKLSIKGDPFWLFPQPIIDTSKRYYNSLKPIDEAIDWIKNAHKRASGAVNIFGSDNFLLIRFRTPRIFNVQENPDSNNAYSDVETFSGVFKVTELTSKFEVGKFHQDIDCYIDPNINIINFLDEIENNASQPDVPTTTDSLAMKDYLPSTAINTQRIMGKIDIPGIQSLSISQLNPSQITGRLGISTKGVNLASNVPTAFPNPLSGLPNIFG